MPTNDLREVLSFLDMLAMLTTAVSRSVNVTGNDTLPPYPALGLAWMMHAASRPYPTLSEIQALHQLASLAASPAMAKILADTAIWPAETASGASPIPLTPAPKEAPSGLGIAPQQNVLIKPRPAVLLSQASIKDHPQKQRIISLAKTLYDSDSPKTHAIHSGKDYLRQALKMVDVPDITNRPCHSVSFTNAQGHTSTFPASTQDLFRNTGGSQASSRSFAQVTKDAANSETGWTKVARKPKPKATIQGTKINVVTAAVPDGFRVPYPSLGINGPEFMEHIRDALRAHPGVLPLLANNTFSRAIWSNNHKRVEVSFQFPPDQQLKLATHTVLASFLGAPIDAMKFIDHPTVSSIKWLAVPHLDANGQIVSEDSLRAQITASGLLS